MEAALSLELDDWLLRDELRLKQKSRDLWLKEGDRNSRFFHLSTLVWRRRNRIEEIKLEDESWINNRSDIQSYFEENFKRTSEPHVPRDLENLIAPCIFEEENRELCRIPSREEFERWFLE